MNTFLYFVRTLCFSIVKSFCLCSWNATYESLLGSNKPFTQPIPLSVSLCPCKPVLVLVNSLSNCLLVWTLTGNGRFSSGQLGARRVVWLKAAEVLEILKFASYKVDSSVCNIFTASWQIGSDSMACTSTIPSFIACFSLDSNSEGLLVVPYSN
jgi:hypothetical protein